MNARKAVLTALGRVLGDNSYSNLTLDAVLAESNYDKTDKAFITALFYGVLDRKITLDYILSQFVKKGLKKTPLVTVNALRMALYQIMYMDKVPSSAAVNESVKLIKASKDKFSANFVNGVLRNILRNEIKLPQDNSVKSLSIRYSCPEWIVKSFVCDYGAECAEKLLEDSLLTPPVTLRVNTTKITQQKLIDDFSKNGVCALEASCENAIEIKGGISVKSDPFYKMGLYHIEDISCQKAVLQLSPKPGETILDMCSSPGGKAFSMAEIMKNNGKIVACDVSENRVSLIKRGVKRLGLTCIDPKVCDATVFNKDLGLFDAVLCDVPCSGLGVIRRKPDIKYSKSDNLESLCETQLSILSNASNYVKSDGRIMYSTCTLRKDENEKIISKFLDKNPDFELSSQYTFMPFSDLSDGFYYALLKRR